MTNTKNTKNTKKKKMFFLGMGWVCFLWYVLAQQSVAQNDRPITDIDIFVAQPLVVASIPNTHITVFDLSRREMLEAKSPEFPPEPLLAEKMAKTWLASEEGKKYLHELQAAYVGHSKMIAYGVLKIPAIVFDKGKFVIYGTTDVSEAVREYDDYIRIHSSINTKIKETE
jgi:integrating conjugative element protein (TIGR03757 family)